ncbi:MAG: iron-containing redox enzyme family protein [Candidatus Marinimicrobia bacterium]|nr:iron-containing redox enzyme family protein [Candidatus Neomarinimicrobiota bacterium]
MNKYIEKLKLETPINKQPFFEMLVDGRLSLEKFQETQIRFLDAVLFFSLPMFILASKIDSYEQRQIVINNILDEHGNGDLKNAHGNTFKEYLYDLGIEKSELLQRKPHDAVINFNQTIMKTVKNRDILVSIAMFGMIEDRYAQMSKLLAQSVLGRGWLQKENLSHYTLHRELDIHHAQSFYNIIRSNWEQPKSYEKIKKGLLLGNALIINLYNSLL